jgi:hypothetical protein
MYDKVKCERKGAKKFQLYDNEINQLYYLNWVTVKDR